MALSDLKSENHDLAHEADRLVRQDVGPESRFPAANGPLAWTRAAALAQVDQAWSLRRIADALEALVNR